MKKITISIFVFFTILIILSNNIAISQNQSYETYNKKIKNISKIECAISQIKNLIDDYPPGLFRIIIGILVGIIIIAVRNLLYYYPVIIGLIYVTIKNILYYLPAILVEIGIFFINLINIILFIFGFDTIDPTS